MNKICMIKQRWQSQKVHGLWEDIHKRDKGQTSTDILVGGCYTYILYIYVLQIHDIYQSA